MLPGGAAMRVSATTRRRSVIILFRFDLTGLMRNHLQDQDSGET
jgi:hypothetical protein